jgi:hypothetical protein
METDRERGDYIDPQAGKVRFEEVAKRWLSSRIVDPATRSSTNQLAAFTSSLPLAAGN